ncbi:MAG: FG-GAP repeat domain-containing protein, partial [Planctomycetota bacterium]
MGKMVLSGPAACVGMILAPAAAQAPFTEESAARGLPYVVEQNATFGCGVAFADLDGDGDPDLVALGRTTPALGVTVGLFENDGTGHFTDRGSNSGIPPLPAAAGVTAADWDGDGDLDLYISVWLEANVLLRNDGDFAFVDVAGEPGFGGIDDPGAGSGCAWADIDGDGWLDLYVANRTGTNHPEPPFPPALEPNRLYRNLG